MNSDLRYAAVAALIGLARSRDHRDRADAGRSLAPFAEIPQAAAALHGLVLDPDDTYVTRATAEALLRRNDPAGLTIVAAALAVADANHADWICEATSDALGVFADDRDEAVRMCGELTQAPDEPLAAGARLMLRILREITPQFHPL